MFQLWWIVYQLNTFHTATLGDRITLSGTDGKSRRDIETEREGETGGGFTVKISTAFFT